MSESFFADYFSPKENLARRPFHDLKEQIETKSDEDPKEFSDDQEDHPKTPEATPPRREKTRAKRTKRGDSLEREIAKLILGEASRMHALYGEVNATRTLSPKAILSDLRSSHDDTPSTSNVTKSKDANEYKRSEDYCFDDTTALGHFAEDSNEILRPRELFPKASSDSDAFDFVANNTEWAVFDDCSVFGTEPKPTNDLDHDGFPVAGEEKSDEEKTVSENFDDKVNQECSLIEAPSLMEKENDEEQSENEKSEKEKTNDVHRPESPSVVSCNDKSVQSESRTGLLDIRVKEKSDDFESKQSPTSVSNFPEKDGFVAPYRTVGPYMLKRQSPVVPKLHWNPKPPAHSNFLLYQPGDTLS